MSDTPALNKLNNTLNKAVLEGKAPDGGDLVVSNKNNKPVSVNMSREEATAVGRNAIRDNFQGKKLLRMGDTGEEIKVNKKSRKELSYKHGGMSERDYNTKMEAVQVLDDIYRTARDVRQEPNNDPNRKPEVDHCIKGRTYFRGSDRRVTNPEVIAQVGNRW